MNNCDMLVSILAQMSILIELLFSDEEEYEKLNNTELENLMFLSCMKRPINPIPRLEGYVEDIIPCYNNEQFKSHFRFVQFLNVAKLNNIFEKCL